MLKEGANVWRRILNRGIKELADEGNESAKGLYESNQTIRIVCESGEEGKKVLEENDTEFPKGPSALMGAGPALTFGDFNEDGSPRKGGTAIIVIDNAYAAKGAFEDPIIKLLGSTVSYYQILLHELLHASHKMRTHGNDGHEVYDIWVKDFEEAVDRVKLREDEEKRRKKPFDWRVGSLPDLFKNPVVVVASLLVGVLACVLCLMQINFFSGLNLLQFVFPVSEPALEGQEVQEEQKLDTIVLNEITFSQVDWYGPENEILLADSLFGIVEWSYVPDPITTNYLNVNAALSLEEESVWVIQNFRFSHRWMKTGLFAMINVFQPV